MKNLILTLCVSIQVTYIYSLNLPQFRCHVSDSGCLGSLTQLLVQSFVNGIPSLGIKSIDPMEFDYARSDQDDLTFEIRDISIHGLKNLVVDEFRVNLKQNMSHSVLRSNVLVTGRYNVNGSVLFSPIYGDGEFSLRMKNFELEIFDSIYVAKNSNGVDFIKSKKYLFDFDVKDGAEFQLSNLYDGNKELSDAMHSLINNNWRFLIRQFGKPRAANVVFRLLSSVYRVLDLVPLNLFVTY